MRRNTANKSSELSASDSADRCIAMTIDFPFYFSTPLHFHSQLKAPLKENTPLFSCEQKK